MDVEIDIVDGILIGDEYLDKVFEDVDTRMAIARIIKGDRGYGVKSILETSREGLIVTYTITYDDGRTDTFQVADGNGISSIKKTSTEAFVDIYTITFENGVTTTFRVANGKGVSSIEKTNTVGLVDTYTITLEDGKTSTFTVTNGKDGDKGASTVADGVPKGGIIMWSGSVVDIPSGWALCNGDPGTPDLRGRFVVGYDPANVDYNKVSTDDRIAKKGGIDNVTLSLNQIPNHKHSFDDYFRFDDPAEECRLGQFGYTDTLGSGSPMSNDGHESSRMFFKTHDTESAGKGGSHENRPPYYTLAFLIKI